MKKQLLIVGILLVFLAVNVLGASVEVRAEAQNHKVEAGGIAEWTLYVKSNQVRTDYYQISADGLSIAPFSDIVRSVEINPTQIEIPSLSTVEVNVKIYLQEDLVADKEYISFVWIKSLTNPKIKEKVELSNFIISSRELVDVKVDVLDDVVPGTDQAFSVTFRNRGNKDLDNLDVYIASSAFSDQKKLSLKAYESLKTNFNFDVESTTLAGKYSMSIRVYQGDSLKGIENIDFDVIENPNINEDDNVEKKFLKKIETIVRENKGNKLVELRVRYPITLLGRIFSSVDPNPKVIKFDDGKFYVWDLSLNPGDKEEITITTNYRIVLALILLILIGVYVFFYFKGKTITITKTLFRIRDEKEHVTEMKIILHVSNKTDSEIHNIKVIDILPNLIKPTPDFATLKPERIQKGPKGMRMIWNIPKLEINEERVISYKVHSRLPLVGEVVLPIASIQYKGKGHKLISARSNRLTFSVNK